MGAVFGCCASTTHLDAKSEQALRTWLDYEGEHYPDGFENELRACMCAALERHRYRFQDAGFFISELVDVLAPGVLKSRSGDEAAYVSIRAEFGIRNEPPFISQYYVYSVFRSVDVDHFKAANGRVVVDKMDIPSY